MKWTGTHRTIVTVHFTENCRYTKSVLLNEVAWGCGFTMFSVIGVYLVLNTDEIIKLPVVYRYYKKYKWLKNITREDSSS